MRSDKGAERGWKEFGKMVGRGKNDLWKKEKSSRKDPTEKKRGAVSGKAGLKIWKDPIKSPLISENSP